MREPNTSGPRCASLAASLFVLAVAAGCGVRLWPRFVLLLAESGFETVSQHQATLEPTSELCDINTFRNWAQEEIGARGQTVGGLEYPATYAPLSQEQCLAVFRCGTDACGGVGARFVLRSEQDGFEFSYSEPWRLGDEEATLRRGLVARSAVHSATQGLKTVGLLLVGGVAILLCAVMGCHFMSRNHAATNCA